MWYLAISGEDLATYAFWNLAIVTNPAICQDKLVNQQCAAHLGSPQDDESSITLLEKGLGSTANGKSLIFGMCPLKLHTGLDGNED